MPRGAPHGGVHGALCVWYGVMVCGWVGVWRRVYGQRADVTDGIRLGPFAITWASDGRRPTCPSSTNWKGCEALMREALVDMAWDSSSKRRALRALGGLWWDMQVSAGGVLCHV